MSYDLTDIGMLLNEPLMVNSQSNNKITHEELYKIPQNIGKHL